MEPWNKVDVAADWLIGNIFTVLLLGGLILLAYAFLHRTRPSSKGKEVEKEED